jgi:hypothetical protein
MNARTTTAATAALTWVGIPKIPRADPIPANSATVEPRLATSIRMAANAPQRTPQRSRMRPISPLPVARPSRAPTSWVKNRTTWLARMTHRSSYPNLAPTSEYVVIPPASLSAKPLTSPGPRTASVARSRTRQIGRWGRGERTRGRGRRRDVATAATSAGPCTRRVRGPTRSRSEGPPEGASPGVLGIVGRYRLNTRGRRFFQAVGMTVSIASSTVTIPTSRPSSSTTGTARRL